MAAGVTGAVTLADVRDLAAAALEPSGPDDPPVLVDVVDSLTPPALMLVWGDPWLAPAIANRPTMGPCLWTARLQVLCVAARMEPGPGIRVLEQLVALTVDRLASDPYTWPLDSVSAPRVFEIAALSYLGARVTYLVPVTV